MKVVHIESGLGNQMLSYCEYLALKKINPDEECYVETIIYDIKECNDIICQWNGYELERIFGIKAPNIKDYCSKEQWESILNDIVLSEFWKKNWNYPVWFTKAFSNNGIYLINTRGDFERNAECEKNRLKRILVESKVGNTSKRIIYGIFKNHYINQCSEKNAIFYKGKENIFTGQRLAFKLKGNGIEKIETDIKAAFRFPPLLDKTNLEMMSTIKATESVAIHARRGDMLGYNGDCYKYGYFKRAVNYIKRHVERPVFIFFCDPGSVEWCRQNEKVFGLDFRKDQVLFTDWNKGNESYRDLQLMAACKHNIITNSSFGWWGAYLNENPGKITCSPNITINTTHHF